MAEEKIRIRPVGKLKFCRPALNGKTYRVYLVSPVDGKEGTEFDYGVAKEICAKFAKTITPIPVEYGTGKDAKMVSPFWVEARESAAKTEVSDTEAAKEAKAQLVVLEKEKKVKIKLLKDTQVKAAKETDADQKSILDQQIVVVEKDLIEVDKEIASLS